MPNDFGPGFHDGIERGVEGGLHWFGIVPVLLFVVLIGVIVWAVITLTREGRGGALAGAGGAGAMPGAATGAMIAGTAASTVAPTRIDPALEELRLRYARGEMTREDYADRLADLTGATSEASTRGPETPGSSAPPPDGS